MNAVAGYRECRQVLAVWTKVSSPAVLCNNRCNPMEKEKEKEKGASFVDNYIDDFITLGCPGTDECHNNAEIMHAVCKEAGVPAEEKSKGLAKRLSFLGIEIDSLSMELRLPSEKLSQLQQILCDWWGKTVASSPGHSQFLMKHAKNGRLFIACFIKNWEWPGDEASKTVCQKRDLQSIIGNLSHACKVMTSQGIPKLLNRSIKIGVTPSPQYSPQFRGQI